MCVCMYYCILYQNLGLISWQFLHKCPGLSLALGTRWNHGRSLSAEYRTCWHVVVFACLQDKSIWNHRWSKMRFHMFVLGCFLCLCVCLCNILQENWTTSCPLCVPCSQQSWLVTWWRHRSTTHMLSSMAPSLTHEHSVRRDSWLLPVVHFGLLQIL